MGAGAADEPVDDREHDRQVDLEDRVPLERLHRDDVDEARGGDRVDVLAVAHLIRGEHVDLHHGAQGAGQGVPCRPAERLVEQLDGAELVLAELAGPQEVEGAHHGLGRILLDPGGIELPAGHGVEQGIDLAL